jgi:YVTN family beta-propeller protein
MFTSLLTKDRFWGWLRDHRRARTQHAASGDSGEGVLAMSAHIKLALSAAAAVLCAASLAMAGAVGAAAVPAHASQPAHVTAYVASSFGNQVAAVDTTTSTVMKMITVGSRPGAIAVTPDGKTAYVATCDGVVPVDIATNTAGPVIKGTKGAGSIAVTPDGKTAYLTYGLVCSSSTPDQVTAVDTATNTVIKQIPWKPGTVWGTSPIVISPDGKTAYLASTAGTLTPLDTTTNTLGKPVKLGFEAEDGNVYLAITPDGKTVYVTWSAPYGPGHQVIPVRTATARVLPAINIRKSPAAIVMSPDGKAVYVASTGMGATGCFARASCLQGAASNRTNRPAAVTPVSTATNTAGPLIELGPTAVATWASGSAQIMAVTPNGQALYVAYNRLGGTRISYVVPISTATNTALPRIDTARGLNSIAITPDGTTAYVTRDRYRNGFDIPGQIVPINTATNTAGRGILVGLRPTVIGITP